MISVPPVVRYGIRTLSTLAPSLAASAAERLWFAPPQPPIPAGSHAFLATGERLDLTVSGRHVAAWSWGSGPAVTLMHGWGGYAAQLERFVAPLVARGYRVLTFDAPGHGASGPSRLGKKRSTFFDFADVLDELTRIAGPSAGLIAHSGGCLATSWALRRGWWSKRVVFVSPMGSPRVYRSMFAEALGFTDVAMQRFSDRVEERLSMRWEELEITATPGVVRTPPLLVLHDRRDRETPFSEAVSIVAAWPDAKLHPTEGLGHRRILSDAAVVEAAVQFIAAD